AVPPSGRTIANYNVYVANSSEGQNFNAAPQYQTLLTSFQLTGLTADTDYYVVVRAQDSEGYEEKNSIELNARTSAIQPISFAGLQSASRGIGSAGFETAMLSWLPGTGSYNEYKV